ncbi:MAG: hypothetical protein HY788_17585 [Deltaproteobacteria bacterium]|nr:hypothetical protein [Deltaproteobacteria bacterium]
MAQVLALEKPQELPYLLRKPLDAEVRRGNVLELEITTRCNLRCPPCVRVAFEDTWIEADMTWKRFDHVLQHAKRFQTIYFRGWGEPLLHPKFKDMVKAAHATGARVVVSTNGVSLFPDGLLPYIHLLEYRMGCGDARVYENQHPGRRFNQILFHIAAVRHWKSTHASEGPLLRLQFTKNRFTITRLQEYIELAAQFKPVEVQLTQPGFHVRSIDEEGVLIGRVPEEELVRIDEELAGVAREENVDLALHENESHCLFNPLEHIFVNWKAQISPCRFTLLPLVDQHFSVYRKGKEQVFKCVDLGNNAGPFDFSKWHLKVRNLFTPRAIQGLPDGHNTLPQICAALCSHVQF